MAWSPVLPALRAALPEGSLRGEQGPASLPRGPGHGLCGQVFSYQLSQAGAPGSACLGGDGVCCGDLCVVAEAGSSAAAIGICAVQIIVA